MAHRILSVLALLGAIALLAAGCGSSQTTTSASSRASATSRAATLTSTAPAASAPAGYALHAGPGFSFAAPEGFGPSTGHLQGIPSWAWSLVLTPGGKAQLQSDAEVFAIQNPKLQEPIDQVASVLRTADRTDPQLTDYHSTISTMTVPGAEEVRIVSESYVTRYRPAHTLFRRYWLMVLPHPGLLIDVVVAVEPKHPVVVDPRKVFESFRLEG